MNAKALKILAGVTLVVVAAAVIFQRAGAGPGAGAELPERVAPGLTDRLNDVAGIEIVSADGTVRLAKQGDEWTLASKDGYPAEFETVKTLLVALAQLTPRERKTADPERYARLGLGDPGQGSASVGVTLTDAGGDTIAGFVIGDQVSAGNTPQRYVRTAGDPQSWLAEGRVDAPTQPTRWVNTSLTQIARDRVTRVTITHPDGETVSIAREQGGTDFVLETLPEGREPKPAGQVGAPASALGFLRLEDVRAADTLAEDAGEPVVAVYETDEGLRVTVRTWEIDGTTWAQIDAAGEAPEPPADAGGEAGAMLADPAGEAAELNDRLAGWLFAIPSFQAESFRKRAADLTDEPAPAAEPDPGEQPEDDAPGFAPRLDAADGPDDGG